MDLPTYTNIWRIEKRLYKLYDFRLPAPLPITWIAVFVGITVPYILFLVVIGLPFNHNLVWLYVLPPGVLTWLTTRPVIESKRLPELVSSQLRYLSEPRTWCRMTPFAEKDNVYVSARVWHRHPPGARPKKAKKAAGRARSAEPVLAPPASQAAEPLVSAEPRRPSRRARGRRPRPAGPWSPLLVPERATARPEAKRARILRARQRGPEPDESQPAPAARPRPVVVQRPFVGRPAVRAEAGVPGARSLARPRTRSPRSRPARPAFLARGRRGRVPPGRSLPRSRPVPRGRSLPRSGRLP